MKRKIVQARNFSKHIKNLLTKNKILKKDFELFKRRLVESPEMGDLIPGTGGIRKTRLKSTSKGKRGGFRVCYFDNPEREELFFILIYQKNEQENLTAKEKKALKELTTMIKARKKK